MEILDQITDLIRSKRTQIPTLPVIVQRVINLACSDDTTVPELGSVISRDQAIANKLLRLANSAYFGFSSKVDSIHRAVSLIGFNEVLGLVVGMGVFSAFKGKGTKEVLDMRGLWLHAIGCATAAREIAKRLFPGESELLFLNGLLHDMGKIFLAVYFPDEYGAVLRSSQEAQIPLFKQEKKMMGLNHADIAGLLMTHWKFPDNLIMPCRFHHRSDSCPRDYHQAALIVELADSLCNKAEIGTSGNPVIIRKESVRRQLRLSLNAQKEVMNVLGEQEAEIEEFLDCLY